MPENCNPIDCPLGLRVDALEEANKQHSKTHREMFDRLRKVETENAVQVEQYTAILKELTALTASHKELSAKLSVLEAKPAKRWEGIVDKALWAVCAAVIAFLLGRVGL